MIGGGEEYKREEAGRNEEKEKNKLYDESGE